MSRPLKIRVFDPFVLRCRFSALHDLIRRARRCVRSGSRCCSPSVFLRRRVTPVTLQPADSNFQFAGYYAAWKRVTTGRRARGAHRRGPARGCGRAGRFGAADFGVGNSACCSTVTRWLCQWWCWAFTIFQHSPAVYIARASPQPSRSTTWAGQRVMVEPAMAELTAYLRREGHADDRLTVLSTASTPGISSTARSMPCRRICRMSRIFSTRPGVDY